MAQAWCLLKPGGLVLWTAPFSTKFHLIPGDYFRYTVDGARALFVDAGFEVVGLHRMGDTALATGYDLGFGSADFTPRHLKAKLLRVGARLRELAQVFQLRDPRTRSPRPQRCGARLAQVGLRRETFKPELRVAPRAAARGKWGRPA